jgi:VWFA-related protein
MLRTSSILFPLALVLATIAARGQNVPSTPQNAESDLPVFHASTDFVLVDALVEDKRTGNLIGNLQPEDFEIIEDSTPQQITYLRQDRLPLSIVFLFDLTETVQPVLTSLAQGASLILSHLKPQDEVAVMVFSSHTELLQGFTTRRISTEYAIRRAADMQTKEGTFIDEDMYEAIDAAMQSTAPQGRRVLVWLTDGTSNFENSATQKSIGKEAPARLHSKQEATDKLMHSGVVVAGLIQHSELTDALITGARAKPDLYINGARVGDIERYADLTGGPVLPSTQKGALTQLATLLDQLRARYTLGYKPAASAPEGSFHKLRVTLTPEAFAQHPEWRKSDIVVRARSGYYR